MQAGPGPRPYDTSLGYVIELGPAAWLDWIELPADGPVHSIESDVGTVLAEVDKVVRVDGESPWLAHIELQASYDPRLRSRLMQYHVLLHHRHQIPVETTVVLLRPAADDRGLTGRFELHSPSGRPTTSFNYRVILQRLIRRILTRTS